jgi:hypothetical protein
MSVTDRLTGSQFNARHIPSTWMPGGGFGHRGRIPSLLVSRCQALLLEGTP